MTPAPAGARTARAAVAVAAPLLVVAVLAGACAQPRFMLSEPARNWPGVYQTAVSAAEQGKFADADRALARYAVTYPDTREALETLFWRAWFQLDPANTAGSPRQAAALLDSYLAGDADAPHRVEAATLKRIAVAMDALRGAATAQERADAGEAAQLRDELAKTKEELQQTKDELERIKKRLATPRP
jgi:TolA-binding protein